DWYFDNDSVKVVVTNLNQNFSSNCVGVGKIVGSTNSYETTNFGFNGLLKWSFVDNNTPRKCEFWCNEGYYVYYVGSEYVGNIHPTCTEKKMNNPDPIYKRDNPQNSTCIVGYSSGSSCDIIFPPKDGALGIVYPSMNCCTQEGFTPTSTSCYCSEIPFCTRLRKLPTYESECVVQGGVCDLNSDCCSNNCQGGVCGSEIFECVVQGGVCDLNSDCCSNNCQGGVCGSEIIPSYNCIGSIDSNALIVEGDDLDLIENVNKVLIESVSSNTLGKCEYYCRPGFEKGSGVDENKCLLIYGYYSGCDESNLAEGWLIYPGDDNDLTILDNITPILSESDTSKKCEYYCDSSLGLVMRNGSCVPQFATEGICGDANRIYYLNEEFPGWGELCKAGSALPNSGFNLGNVEGDFVKWLCTARDVNANCRATRSEANIFDVNAILNFSVNNINGEIVGSVSCSKETKADLILVDEKGNNIEFSPKIVNCSYSPNSFEINPSIDLNEGVFYSIRASIKENSLDCSICSKTVLFTPRKVRDEKIPDNSFTLVIIILLLVINILIRKTN
ncbi:MAG: hypothetical protein PHO61_03885, partial [Candidatus ainarchaeum sp.]|nr:hypothetical protein [Candidatus ainarchaeum sp.]